MKRFGKVYAIFFVLVIPLAITAVEPGHDFFSISVDGRTRAVVTDPAGQRMGSIGRAVWQEHSGARLGLQFGAEQIEYPAAKVGDYHVDWYGQYDEQYDIDMYYISNGTYTERSFTRWSNRRATSTMQFSLQSASTSGWVVDSPQFNHPLGRAVKTDNSQVTLHWNAVDGAQSYNVYYKYWDYPYYKALASTTATSTNTDVSWAVGETGVYYFRITAVLGDGTETIFSPIITNDDIDGDGYSDYREQHETNTNPESADSDGDGVDDFSEINRWYTDPNNADSDGDGHSDGDEVAAGTLPNQSADFPGVTTDCRAPQSGDWHINNHCDVVSDQIVDRDIVVHPRGLMDVAQGVTVWFDYVAHKILVMFGGGINLQPGAQIKQK